MTSGATRMKILVIDDDPIVVTVVKMILSASGYEVDDASSGNAGLALAMTGEYNGIVLDLGLGDRTGVSVILELREKGIMTPVLVLTGDTKPETVRIVLEAGANEHVVKPVNAGEL